MLFILIFIVLTIIAFANNKGTFHSHWSHLIDNFNYSSQEFYGHLKQGVTDNKIRECGSGEVIEKEGGVFSLSRKYFKINWREYNFYMCAAPFGNGFFLSWHLFYKQRKREILVGSIPFIGSYLMRKLFPITMYRIDTSSMFMKYCHEIMLSKLNHITETSGIKLDEEIPKPVLNDIFKRN